MIQIRNIHKAFNGNPILRGIDLDVDKGNVVVILGPSGSGKTTFLRCLNALEMPEQGMIEFSGEAPLKINFAGHPSKKDILALRRKTGMVFQQYNLFPHKTALENVMEGPVAVQGKSVAEAREQALLLLQKVGLGDKIDPTQMEALDALDTGTDVDLWDCKYAREMRSLRDIFAEVVSEHQTVASTATLYDHRGTVVKKYTDGVPARLRFALPADCPAFQLDVLGRRIHQVLSPQP